MGHKKRATLLWTITSAFLDGFQHLPSSAPIEKGINVLP